MEQMIPLKVTAVAAAQCVIEATSIVILAEPQLLVFTHSYISFSNSETRYDISLFTSHVLMLLTSLTLLCSSKMPVYVSLSTKLNYWILVTVVSCILQLGPVVSFLVTLYRAQRLSWFTSVVFCERILAIFFLVWVNRKKLKEMEHLTSRKEALKFLLISTKLNSIGVEVDTCMASRRQPSRIVQEAEDRLLAHKASNTPPLAKSVLLRTVNEDVESALDYHFEAEEAQYAPPNFESPLT